MFLRVYRAVWHRVKHRNIDRLSIPFFVNLGYHDAPEPCHPGYHDAPEPCHPRSSQKLDDTPQLNKPLKYGEFLKKGLWDLIVSNGQR